MSQGWVRPEGIDPYYYFEIFTVRQYWVSIDDSKINTLPHVATTRGQVGIQQDTVRS